MLHKGNWPGHDGQNSLVRQRNWAGRAGGLQCFCAWVEAEGIKDWLQVRIEVKLDFHKKDSDQIKGTECVRC